MRKFGRKKQFHISYDLHYNRLGTSFIMLYPYLMAHMVIDINKTASGEIMYLPYDTK